MNRRCVDCGDLFYADERWKVRCLDCWRERKDARERGVPLRGRGSGYEAGRDAGYKDGFDDGRSFAADTAPGMDADLLHDAVLLCHPDRHPPERFQRANDVTARLLALLKEHRGAA